MADLDAGGEGGLEVDGEVLGQFQGGGTLPLLPLMVAEQSRVVRNRKRVVCWHPARCAMRRHSPPRIVDIKKHIYDVDYYFYYTILLS